MLDLDSKDKLRFSLVFSMSFILYAAPSLDFTQIASAGLVDRLRVSYVCVSIIVLSLLVALDYA